MVASQTNYSRKRAVCGLTLIEVLIALAIISIALTAIIKTTSQHIRGISYLQDKSIALWVGQQVINEVRVGLIKGGREASERVESIVLLDRVWYFRVLETETPNKHIIKITVDVFKNADQDRTPIVTLESYLYHEN